jgi:hypothetical protein
VLISEQEAAYNVLVGSARDVSRSMANAKAALQALAAAGGLDELDAWFAGKPTISKAQLSKALDVAWQLVEVMAKGNNDAQLSLVREVIAAAKATAKAAKDEAFHAAHTTWVCASCGTAGSGLPKWTNEAGKPLCKKNCKGTGETRIGK